MTIDLSHFFGSSLTSRRDFMCFYACSLLFTPYHYGTAHGGDDPMGMDCSGFVSEVLQATGLVPHRARVSAQGWHDTLIKRGCHPLERPRCGALQFFINADGRVYHVNICLSDVKVIGAIGGTSRTVDDATAAQDNGFVKIRELGYQGESAARVVYLDPFEQEALYGSAHADSRSD